MRSVIVFIQVCTNLTKCGCPKSGFTDKSPLTKDFFQEIPSVILEFLFDIFSSARAFT